MWGGADRSLRLWPGSRHETLNDLDHEAVAAELLDWLLARSQMNTANAEIK
jgi:alpha-beta hydrolase superfamily lysophospholipase